MNLNQNGNDNFIGQLIDHWNGQALFGLSLKNVFIRLYHQSEFRCNWTVIDDKKYNIFYIQPAENLDNGLVNPKTRKISFVNSKSLGLICTYSIIRVLMIKDHSHDTNAQNILNYLKYNNPYLVDLSEDIATDFHSFITNNKQSSFQ